MFEIVEWTIRRCRQRAIEVARESDRNHQGVSSVLRWLCADLYTFEQKFTTLGRIDASVENAPEFLVIGEQLRRLIYRCKRILAYGHDPGASAPFTFEIPSPLLPLRTGAGDGFQFVTTEPSIRPSDLEARFRQASVAIREVAQWIEDGGYVVE